jgi:hypothetical protein
MSRTAPKATDDKGDVDTNVGGGLSAKIRRFKDDRLRFIFDRMQVASGDTFPALA